MSQTFHNSLTPLQFSLLIADPTLILTSFATIVDDNMVAHGEGDKETCSND